MTISKGRPRGYAEWSWGWASRLPWVWGSGCAACFSRSTTFLPRGHNLSSPMESEPAAGTPASQSGLHRPRAGSESRSAASKLFENCSALSFAIETVELSSWSRQRLPANLSTSESPSAFESEYRRTWPCPSSFLDWEVFVWTVPLNKRLVWRLFVPACRPSHNAGRRPEFWRWYAQFANATHRK